MTGDFSSPPTPPVTSTVSKVVNYLKEEIFSGNLKSGDRIPSEVELCEKLNVSRTSVREAIKILDSMTVVRVRQGDGTYISKPEDISFTMPWLFKIRLSDITWREINEFREQLEFLILRSAIANATEEDILRLEALVEEMDKFINDNPDDRKGIYEHDMRFHEALVDISKNKIIGAIYEFAYRMLGPLMRRNLELQERVIARYIIHRHYVDAIRRRDVFLAYTVCTVLLEGWSVHPQAEQGVPYWPFGSESPSLDEK